MRLAGLIDEAERMRSSPPTTVRLSARCWPSADAGACR